MRKSCLTLILWLMAAAGFAAPLPGFVLAGQTAHFSFYSRGEKVDMGKVEKRMGEIEKLFGQSLTGRANYYRYSTAQEVAAGTGHYAAGVTFAAANEIHSTEACHDHELVHLIANRFGNPGTFFQEGLAVAVGNKGEWQGKSADKTAKATSVDIAQLAAGFDRFDRQHRLRGGRLLRGLPGPHARHRAGDEVLPRLRPQGRPQGRLREHLRRHAGDGLRRLAQEPLTDAPRQGEMTWPR